ncbi:MAG TPA: glycosyl hydrolase family 28-related protein, partial [Verrucomicrobiae bacterium]|nr:glycosyl hydrolase family 28-related protein [Verrucomicrobiae bacterium]
MVDPKAVYISPSGGDDTAALQNAIDKVQETTGQGLVLLAPGRYRISDTLYIWPSIRLIGYGEERPVIVLPAHTAGFTNASHEKVMIFFAGRRPRGRQATRGPVPDANPGTFYSALANIDIEVEEGNAGAVGVRARYAQHCFLAHMDFHLGSALAGIHEGGNVVEDVHFFGGTHAVWTSKPSPGWQFTFIDCSFEDQREAAILEHEAGLTLVRPHFKHVKTAVEIEPEWVDELWIKDARLEEISGPAFIFGMEKSLRNEINMEHVDCQNVPVFAALRDSGEFYSAPASIYTVTNFSHGLHYADIGSEPGIETHFDAAPLTEMPPPVETDLTPLPDCSTWANIRDLGAKGDGVTDDTEAFRAAIASNRASYLPSGFYIVHDTLMLQPDTVLIGLHPGATQIILPDGVPAYAGSGGPKALLETPAGGSNIVIGIGLYTSGNNPRAVAALWKAGSGSLMNDVRFLGGHGTPKPDGSRENPYNGSHTADPNPNRHWDSEYPSLWVTDGGGGTFLDIWTPSTFARAGMLVSDTQTEGRAYQISIEHHVHHELQVTNAAYWSFYALQTEEERGESGLALPIEIVSSHDITFANFHSYRVISSFQPFACAVSVSDSRDIHFRNFHCDSNSKASFDSAICETSPDIEIRQHEFSWLDISGKAPARKAAVTSPVVAHGAKVKKLAGGFFNISGGAVGPRGDYFFVDAHPQRIYRWDATGIQLSIVSDERMEPVNLAADEAGNLMVISYDDDVGVYAVDAGGKVMSLRPQTIKDWSGKRLYLPVSDWRLNRGSLGHPAAWYVSPDGTTVLPVGKDFLDGATSWGVKSSPEIRSFGLDRATPGKPFYVTSESEL